jgi:hypothetical protein
VSSAAITLYDASQRGFIVVYFVIDSVRKLLDNPRIELLKYMLEKGRGRRSYDRYG